MVEDLEIWKSEILLMKYNKAEMFLIWTDWNVRIRMGLFNSLSKELVLGGYRSLRKQSQGVYFLKKSFFLSQKFFMLL